MSQPRVFSLLSLADRWGCSKTTILRMMARGYLKRMDFPLIRFDLAQIEQIESGQKKAAGNLVYFIKANDLIKIGETQEIIYRFRSLSASSPVPLVLIGTIEGGREMERQLHKRFAHLRRHGEWFSNEGALLEYLADTFKGIEYEPS